MYVCIVKQETTKPLDMKQVLFLLTLPFAFWAARPILHGHAFGPTHHGYAIGHHPMTATAPTATYADAAVVPVPETAVPATVQSEGLPEIHRQVAASVITLDGIGGVPRSDEDMDLQFSLENGMTDFSKYTAAADAAVGEAFSFEQDRIGTPQADMAVADQEIDARFRNDQ
jgi:hypothetical protein